MNLKLRGDFLKRFWSHVDVRGPDECWAWLACRDRDGYGVFGIGNSDMARSQRISYTLEKGEIPERLVVDHLCRNRACVNPAHLEAVTRRENTIRGFNPPAYNLRKTHCKYGHVLNGRNLYFRFSGSRGCKVCARRWRDEVLFRNRAEQMAKAHARMQRGR